MLDSMVQNCDCKVVAESQRVVVGASSHSRGTIIPVLSTSASTAILFVACRCATAMLAPWSTYEVDLLVAGRGHKMKHSYRQ